MRLRLFVLFALSLILTACALGGNHNDRPDWIDHADEGAVGSSTTHVRGRSYQEELAFQRAVTRLAASEGVKVTSSTLVQQQATDSSSSSSLNQTMLVEVEGISIAVEVIGRWRDPYSNEFFIWVKRAK